MLSKPLVHKLFTTTALAGLGFLVLVSLSTTESHNRLEEMNDLRGEWNSFRADAGASGHASVPFVSLKSPIEKWRQDLHIVDRIDPRRVVIREHAGNGPVAFVSSSGALVAYNQNGQQSWKVPGTGSGEIIDVIDLDGDGTDELIFSSIRRLNLETQAASGPGIILIYDATTGRKIWEYQLEGLQLGLNRYRTSITQETGNPSKTLIAAITYDYSMLKFNFDLGVKNGYLHWKSDTLHYDSPDKRPLVIESGLQRSILLDSFGTLYQIGFADGVIRSAEKYSDYISFGGSLFKNEAANSDDLISVTSTTAYAKGAAGFQLARNKLSPLWKREFEIGLENQNFRFSPWKGPISLNGKSRLLWSLENTHTGEYSTLELVDATDGSTDSKLSVMGRLVDVLMETKDTYFAVIQNRQSVSIIRIDSRGMSAVWQKNQAVWIDPNIPLRPSKSEKTVYRSFGMVVSSLDRNNSKVIKISNGRVRESSLPSKFRHKKIQNVVAASSEFVYVSSENDIWKISKNDAPTHLFTMESQSFQTPLVASSLSKSQIIIQKENNLVAIDYPLSHTKQTKQTKLIDNIIPLTANSFFGPVISPIINGQRFVVGFSRQASGPYLEAIDIASGKKKWSFPIDENAWETSIAISKSLDKDERARVFMRNGLQTLALDLETGDLLWKVNQVGQCQRQISVVDWNDDGISDIVYQAGEYAFITDGKNGTTLFTTSLPVTYGAFVSGFHGLLDRETEKLITMHAAGGFAFISKTKGLISDREIEPRKTESLAQIAGFDSRGRPTFTSITGSGKFEIYDQSGHVLRSFQIQKPVVVASGAFIDDDDITDYLVSTYSGQILAVSGANGHNLWTLNLDSIPGTPVLADLDNDGAGELIVVTTDGLLRVFTANQ